MVQAARSRGATLIALTLLASLALLAACGRTTSGDLNTAPTATTVATRATFGATANGCFTPQAPADAGSFTPDVVVTQQTTASSSISLTKGQRLELRLTPTVRWGLTLSDPDHTLASAPVQGWYDASVGACVWRFSAVGAGQAELNFDGTSVCPKGGACAQPTDLAQSYSVVVR